MQTPDKYLSIITNFGRHYTCPYCIVKNNNMDIPKTRRKSLKKLKAAVEHENANIISVSGGGDPLHGYPNTKRYYDILFSLCEEMNIPLEMHTSYIHSTFPYEKCHRVVYHCHSTAQLPTIKRHGNEIVRVVFVVTGDFTQQMIDNIYTLVSMYDSIDELSFRQMVGKDRVTHYCQDYLREFHKDKWWYIEQIDYNPYFVNGDIYYKFSDISSN